MEERKNNLEISENFIDIERVISQKNPKLLKIIPHFLINYLKRVIHEKELNKAIFTNRHKFGLDFLDAVFDQFGAKMTAEGLNNISQQGRFVIASNHPLGGLDGIALMSIVGKMRNDIVFPVNDILMNLPNISDLFIPVNKHGSNANNISVFEETFASDRTLLYFPAGLCSRKQAGRISDLEWKKSFISKARKHKRDIIPTHIDGRNSNFFYNLANIRKFLGIKANIEMLYLVDEMYKQKNKHIRIVFGKPIPFQVFDKRFTDTVWAEHVKTFVYSLEKNQNSTFPFINV
ncbi:MAG: 1-acyl-sn-glycerol-3-phosphate acyltransferase [Bacteroidales bacterium]